MHAETLAYMLHQLPQEKKGRQTQVTVAPVAPPAAAMVAIRKVP